MTRREKKINDRIEQRAITDDCTDLAKEQKPVKTLKINLTVEETAGQNKLIIAVDGTTYEREILAALQHAARIYEIRRDNQIQNDLSAEQ